MKKLLFFALAFFGFQVYSQAQTLHHFGWFGHQILHYEITGASPCGVKFTIAYSEYNVKTYESQFCTQDEKGMLFIFNEDGTQLGGTLSILPEVANFAGNYYGLAYDGAKGDCRVQFAMAGGHSSLQVKWPSKGLSEPLGFALAEEEGPNFEALETLLQDKENYRGKGQVKAKFTLQNFHIDASEAIFLEVVWTTSGAENMLDLRFTGALKAQIQVPVSALLD